jgi:inhibitor of KinA
MSFIIYPIGDSAATIELGDIINEAINRKVIAMQVWLKENHSSAFKEITIAYSSLSVYYDLLAITALAGRRQSPLQYISGLLELAFHNAEEKMQPEKVIKIPVCYHPSLGLDLNFLSEQKSLKHEEIIALHVSRLYRVYMIGFLPGFPYMAEVDSRIAVPRKVNPRPLVKKGSVGIAGTQTGIYPLDSPGGWQIIGRTPFSLFTPYGQEVVPISPGDYVQFSEISLEEFHQLNN